MSSAINEINWVEETPETHRLTRNWIHNFSQIEDLEDEIFPSVFERLEDLNEDLWIDLVKYFFREYYILEKSYKTIGIENWIPTRTLARWFGEYFKWESRDSNTEVTENAKKLSSKSLAWNNNWKKWYQSYQRNTSMRVQELLILRSSHWTQKSFPLEKFNSFKKPLYKIKIIFEYFWYQEDFFENIVKSYSESGLWITAIKTIVNTLVESLVGLLDVNILSPKISKQTISKYLKK